MWRGRVVAPQNQGVALPRMGHDTGCWVLGAGQSSPWGRKWAPSLSGMCTAPPPPRVGQAPLGLPF